MIGEWDLDVIEECIADLGTLLEKYTSASSSKIVIEILSFIKSGSLDPSAMAFRAHISALMMTMNSQHDGSVPNSNVVMRAELKRIMDKVRNSTVAKHPEIGNFFNANISSGMEKSAALFEENYGRLRELKRKFDPGFVFEKWFPIPPAEAREKRELQISERFAQAHFENKDLDARAAVISVHNAIYCFESFQETDILCDPSSLKM